MDWVGKLVSAKNVVVLTGAGVSAESGIPTFRGKDGLWKNFRAEELATNNAFENNPSLVWEWYQWRQKIISKAKPNPAHFAIAKLENIKDSQFSLITQNVDDLHSKAGSKNQIELHGNIFRTRCPKCGKIDTSNQEIKTIDTKDIVPLLPHCSCGGLLRPDIVWFGEPVLQITEAFTKSEKSEIMLVVGTSGMVAPASYLPTVAKENGATIIEFNISKTPISAIADYSIFEEASKSLPKVIIELQNFLDIQNKYNKNN